MLSAIRADDLIEPNRTRPRREHPSNNELVSEVKDGRVGSLANTGYTNKLKEYHGPGNILDEHTWETII